MHILHHNRKDRTPIIECHIEGSDLVYTLPTGKVDRIALKAIDSIVNDTPEEMEANTVWVIEGHGFSPMVFKSRLLVVQSVDLTYAQAERKPVMTTNTRYMMAWDNGMKAFVRGVNKHADHL